MTTHTDRWYQAHKHAQAIGDARYELAPDGWKAQAYFDAYTSEMDAFARLERMRQPSPRQELVDAESAAMLRPTRPWKGD